MSPPLSPAATAVHRLLAVAAMAVGDGRGEDAARQSRQGVADGGTGEVSGGEAGQPA
ncbi:hypothetical protein ACH5A7_21950 [Streptomyces sp. NPDC018955]|uniref:hypothetical protein n=1 Tax=Streptomyces sp. NPDC018955 TaxID=3365055 RepID=UPI00378FA45E